MEYLYNSRIYLYFFGFFFGFLIILLTVISCKEFPKKEIQSQNTNLANMDSQEMDAQFLVDAVEIHMMELQLGQLEQKKSNAADVKELGRKMEEGYHDSYTKLLALAKKKLVTLPTITTKKAQTAYDKLNEKSGTQFDKAYCNMMVSQQNEAIVLFEKASTTVKDPDIKAWVVETLPLLKIHLDYAIQCQKEKQTL